METFSQRLIQARRNKGMSQAELSTIAGVSTTTLSAYENNGRPPALDVAKKIADALDVSLDWLADTGKQAELTNYTKIDNIIHALLEIIKNCDTRISTDTVANDNLQIYEDIVNIEFYADCTEGSKAPIVNRLIIEFFQKWKDLQELYDKGTLDNEVYNEMFNAWFEKTMRTFRVRQLKYDLTGTDEFEPEDLHSDDELYGF